MKSIIFPVKGALLAQLGSNLMLNMIARFLLCPYFLYLWEQAPRPVVHGKKMKIFPFFWNSMLCILCKAYYTISTLVGRCIFLSYLYLGIYAKDWPFLLLGSFAHWFTTSDLITNNFNGDLVQLWLLYFLPKN